MAPARNWTVIVLGFALSGVGFGACSAFSAGENVSSSSSSSSSASSGNGGDAYVLTPTDGAGAGDGDGSGNADASDGYVAFNCGNARLCDDFDRANNDAGWSKTDLAAPGEVGISDDRATSNAHSLRSKLPSASPDTGFARLSHYIPNWPKVRLSFDLYVEDPKWTGAESDVAVMSVAGFGLDSQSKVLAGLDLVFSKQNLKINIAVPSTSGLSLGGAIAPSPYNEWLPIVIEFEPTATGGTGRLFVGGKLITPTNTIQWPQETPKQTRVYVGLDRYNATTPSFTTYYDNVKIETY